VRGGGTDGDALWDSTADVTLDGGGLGSVIFQAQIAGATLAPASTTWEIVTAVSGWTGATNAADATPGANRETDDQLRIRRQQSLQGAGSASARALLAKLREIEGVTAAVVLENDDALDATIEGVLITSHTVATFVTPSTLSIAERDAVFRVIYENVCAGVRTQGTESATVSADGLAPKIVRFSFAGTEPVTVTISVTLDSAALGGPLFADVEADAQAVLAADYVPLLGLGDDVLLLDVLGGIADVTGIRSANAVVTVGTPDAQGNAIVNATDLAVLTFVFVDLT
jgi:hypothetical protein